MVGIPMHELFVGFDRLTFALAHHRTGFDIVPVKFGFAQRIAAVIVILIIERTDRFGFRLLNIFDFYGF